MERSGVIMDFSVLETTLLNRRSTDECNEKLKVCVEPCALHDTLPEMIGKLLASGQWLVRLTKVYMVCLGTVICAAFTAVIAINMQYNIDMRGRDTARNLISERVFVQASRISVIEHQLKESHEKETEIVTLLNNHIAEWRKAQEKKRGIVNQ